MYWTLVLLFCFAANGECREVPRPGQWQSFKACALAGETSGAHAWKCVMRTDQPV